MYFFFFFKQKTAYEMRISDWSSDVCSSDLDAERVRDREEDRHGQHQDGDAVQEHGQQQQHHRQDEEKAQRREAEGDQPVGDVLRPALVGEQELEDADAAEDRKSTRLNSSH